MKGLRDLQRRADLRADPLEVVTTLVRRSKLVSPREARAINREIGRLITGELRCRGWEKFRKDPRNQ